MKFRTVFGIACVVCATATPCLAQDRAARDSTVQAVLDVLKRVDWTKICTTGRRCPVVLVDTLVYHTRGPIYSANADSVLVTLPSHRIAALSTASHRFTGDAQVVRRSAGADTAVISFSVLEFPDGRPGIRRIDGQTLAPHTTFGMWIRCDVKWDRGRWRITKMALVEG